MFDRYALKYTMHFANIYISVTMCLLTIFIDPWNLLLMWNSEVCESKISARTKLHYVSPTIRSWVRK